MIQDTLHGFILRHHPDPAVSLLSPFTHGCRHYCTLRANVLMIRNIVIKLADPRSQENFARVSRDRRSSFPLVPRDSRFHGTRFQREQIFRELVRETINEIALFDRSVHSVKNR